MEQFLFFWNGMYSQWHKAKMSLQVPTRDRAAKTLEFNCCEQYMMYMKAATFHDWDIAEEIMRTSNPKEQKALGRKVRGFVDAKWKAVCRQVVFDGNYAKFTQNADLEIALRGTQGYTIVEASPYDTIWGIGLAEHDPRAHDRSQWRGTNWLGEALMQVRDQILGG